MTFIVAEMSCNHLGKLQTALQIIDAAADAKADAVKISIDNINGGLTINCKNEYFKIRAGTWKGENLYELYKRTITPWKWLPLLKERANKQGLELFSTVSCAMGIVWCERFDIPRYKISSFEACDVPLIGEIKKTGKPVIVSCGKDWEDAQTELYKYDASFLYCVSKYPAAVTDFDLDEATWFDGISDHSLGHTIAIAAVARGAKIVEKHLTLSRDNGSADAAFSMEPGEFKTMVQEIRYIEHALKPKPHKVNRELCKSIFAVRDIQKGERFTEKNIKVIRPHYGLKPKEYDKILGCIAKKKIKRGTPIKESMI